MVPALQILPASVSKDFLERAVRTVARVVLDFATTPNATALRDIRGKIAIKNFARIPPAEATDFVTRQRVSVYAMRDFMERHAQRRSRAQALVRVTGDVLLWRRRTRRRRR